MPFLNALLRVLAVVILAVVVVLAPITLLLRDAGALLFDPQTTKALVKENFLDQQFMADFAEQMVQGMLESSVEEAGAEGGSGFSVVIEKGLAELDEADWAQLTSLIAPPTLIAETTDTIIDGYAEWLTSDETLPAITIELSAWKRNISQNARPIMIIVMDGLPECTLEEIGQQVLEGLTGGEGIGAAVPVCRPPEPIYSVVLDNADRMAAGITQGAPDSVDLSSIPIQDSEQILQFKESLNRARLVTTWSWLLVFGLGALAVVMAARTWPAALRWSGWPALLIGAGTLLLGLGLTWFGSALPSLLARMPSDGPAFVPVLAGGMGAGVLSLVSRPLLIQGLVLVVLGIMALFGARYLDDREGAQQAKPAPAPRHPVETTPVRRVNKERDRENGD